MRESEDVRKSGRTPTQRATSHFCQMTSYLVEEIDNLGENVEASSWVDGGLIEDTCL